MKARASGGVACLLINRAGTQQVRLTVFLRAHSSDHTIGIRAAPRASRCEFPLVILLFPLPPSRCPSSLLILPPAARAHAFAACLLCCWLLLLRGFDSLPFLSGIARAAAAAPSLTVSSDELICGHGGGGCIVGRSLINQGGREEERLGRETRYLGLKRDRLPSDRLD